MAIAGYTAPLKISTGTFTFDEINPAADKVNVTINTTSVDTNHAERDKHLRSADFLNTTKYPQATFTSTSVKKDGDELDITGDLTLNGGNQTRHAGSEINWSGATTRGAVNVQA
ncbi:protein YceI precursor [Escherichia coli]|uniref:Protein YceI n=1 Tax=Escherichia coli TaxID=562 RepID=A0A377E5G6_ECOLX|nr:protein YceI precursor [Escherichia coli]